MIKLYVGSVGSGKSYHALTVGLSKIYALRRNLVVANFPIKFNKRDVKKGINKRWRYVDDIEELTPANLLRYSFEQGFFGKEGYCLLIIDEAGLFFNSRDWQVNPKRRKDWIKFFSQSRKAGYDIIMIAQDDRMIDRQIRKMAEHVVKHVKLRNYFWLKWLPLQVFCAVSYWCGGSFRGQPSLITFLPWVAKRYDTMRMFDMNDPELMRLMAEYKGINALEGGRQDNQGSALGAEAKGQGFPSPATGAASD